jgi:hypothetical protein
MAFAVEQVIVGEVTEFSRAQFNCMGGVIELLQVCNLPVGEYQGNSYNDENGAEESNSDSELGPDLQ